MNFTRSRELGDRLAALVPGGAHTYAKGPDQFPELSPSVLSHGFGCHVWDMDGNEFIEYGMGLRAVGLGHAYPDVVAAVRDSLRQGTNFTRPAFTEVECAELFLSIVPGAEMVKFTKDGSTATSAALKLARAATGRTQVAVCADHPFFSYDDWFISTTSMAGGIPPSHAETIGFRFNDTSGLRAMFAEHGASLAAVMLEVARTDPPEPDFLSELRDLCNRHGTVLIFDEMITGFRYHLHGAQHLYGVLPDLSTWGKALANGFSVSALCGSRDLMRLGSRERPGDDVFLLSTTHGAEIPALHAAIATMQVYQREPVVEHFYRQGEALIRGVTSVAAAHGLTEHVKPVGFPCNLLYATLDAEMRPSQALRTLLLQETIARGVLMPSLVVSYSHTDDDIARTIEAIDGALAVYAKALESGTDGFLVGSPSRTVFDRRWR